MSPEVMAHLDAIKVNMNEAGMNTINIVLAFVMFGVDKKRAINDQWRIPEKTLLGVALAGGSVGAFAGMQIFNTEQSLPSRWFKGSDRALLLGSCNSRYVHNG